MSTDVKGAIGGVVGIVFALSLALNGYYYTTASSVNDQLRTGVATYAIAESGPLSFLQIGRTEAYTDALVREAKRIISELEADVAIQRTRIRTVETENTQLRASVTQVRAELEKAQESGRFDFGDLLRLLPLLF